MQPITYSVSKGLRIGAISGFIGAIALGIFGEIGALAMNQELFYTTIARKLASATLLFLEDGHSTS